MTIPVRATEIVAALPSPLAALTVYYVERPGQTGYDVVATDADGAVIAVNLVLVKGDPGGADTVAACEVARDVAADAQIAAANQAGAAAASAGTATAKAQVATGQAMAAAGSAGAAAGSAATATAKAQVATDQAAAAAGSAGAAAGSAATATAKAQIATDQAVISTAGAGTATAKAQVATDQAALAVQKAQEAVVAAAAAMAGQVPADWTAVAGVQRILNKPTTLAGYGITDALPSSAKGSANGVAPLGADSKIPSAYLPAYVDDVLEYAALAALPATGESGKIYVALDTNLTYRWSGSQYVKIAAGDVNSVAGLTGSISSASLKTAMSLVPGADVQAYSANLAAWSGIAPASKADASALSNYAALAGATFTGFVNAPGLNSTGQSNFQGNQQGTIAQSATTGYGSGSLMVQGPGAAGGAYMSFHRPGAYAACFGLDTDNYWKVGGWSMGTNSYKIFHEGNPPPQSYVGGRITGSTGAILSSSGIASVSRAGGGAYTVTLSAARASVNYAVIATARHAGGWLSVMEADAGEYTKSTTSFRLKVGSDTLGAVDPNQLSFIVLGG